LRPHFETTFDKLTNFWLCEKLSALVALTASCRILQEKIGGTFRCGSGSLSSGREHFQSSLLPCWEPWNIWDLGCWDSPTSGSGCSWRFFHFRRWKSRTPHWSIWWSCGFLRRFQWRHLPLHLDYSKITKQLSSNIFGEAPNQWLCYLLGEVFFQWPDRNGQFIGRVLNLHITVNTHSTYLLYTYCNLIKTWKMFKNCFLTHDG